MKVCMLIGAFPPDYSGAGSQAYHLIKKLQCRGVRCFVLTRHLTNNERPAPGDVEEEVDDIQVYRLSFGENSLRRPFSLRVAAFLRKKRHSFDIIHCHGIFWPTYVGILLAHLMGKASLAKVTQFGTDDLSAIRGRRLGHLQVALLSRVDRLIAISSQLATDYQSDPAFADKVVQLPNGVDTKVFQPIMEQAKEDLRRKLGLPLEALLITFVGIVKHRKGVDVLVDAWIRLARSFPQVALTLVGPCDAASQGGTIDLEYVADLRRRIATSGLEKRVFWIGQVADVVPYLQASDIFVLPSRREGLPNALLEAMACGLPCIASDLDSVQEVMLPGTGLIFERGNANALAEHLISLAADQEKRHSLGAAARERVERDFSLDAIADRYVALYRDLMKR